jgi:hypothetical protein
MGNVAPLLLWRPRRMPLGGGIFPAAAALGLYPAIRGNTLPHRWVLWARIAVAAANPLTAPPSMDSEACGRVETLHASLRMHYTRMLCLRGLGDAAGAARERALFRRFKAEESAQDITAKPRLISPENNNERRQIHDLESVPL